MKLAALPTLLVALTLSLPGLSMAQGRDEPRDAHGEPARHAPDAGHHAQAPVHQARNDHRDERGAGPQHSFHRGDHLSSEYRSKQYVVDDWRGHHLHAPPRGYHWVQTGPDYVLAAIATGIIADVLLNQ
jgi:Ni/Co efflux regulator RcnB